MRFPHLAHIMPGTRKLLYCKKTINSSWDIFIIIFFSPCKLILRGKNLEKYFIFFFFWGGGNGKHSIFGGEIKKIFLTISMAVRGVLSCVLKPPIRN